MDSVETFCEEICIMKNGQLVLSGALSDIKKSYQYKYMTLQTEGDIEPILKKKNFNFEKVNRTFMIKVNDGEDAFSRLKILKLNNISEMFLLKNLLYIKSLLKRRVHK